jgi:hypothetical protein
MSYGDQLADQASNRQDENMKHSQNNENAPEKVLKLRLAMWFPTFFCRICGI